MRNKLEYIQVIDKYLRGVLSKEDTAIFENRLTTDSQLRTEVLKQKLLMEGIKRNALKTSAQKGRKSYKTIKTLKTVGIGLAVVAITALSAYAFFNKESNTNPEVQETISTNLGIESLENQNFNINTLSDTVIETENGIVLAIPSGAFETEEGESVSGEIEFEIKEAFDEYDIMKAGLTTTSNGELLETGGMFFLEATQNGKKLRLKKDKEILSQLPNRTPEKEMQLYDGVKQNDGTINWVNPKPFEKELIPVEITSLDFYPEGYVEEVTNTKEKVLVRAEGDLPTEKMTVAQAKELSYKYPTVWTVKDALKLKLITREYKEKEFKNLNYDKVFTDSLYYSFARLFERKRLLKDTFYSKKINDKSVPKIKYVVDSTYGFIAEELETAVAVKKCPIPSGINPAKVKAIWNKKFNNTILATKEFEERMKVIHQSHQDRILQVYVRNLDKPLWYSDSIASRMNEGTTKQFVKFYKQRKGGINIKDKLANKLSAYFNKKQAEFTSKSAKAFQEFQEKKNKLRQEFEGKKGLKVVEEYKRKSKVFNEEYEMNLCNAATQIGKKGYCGEILPKGRNAKGVPYKGVITTLGAKNIDRAVFEATRDRKTLNYTDPVTGKKAVIKYEPLQVTVLNTQQFDRVFMYLVPDKLNSFNRMKTSNKKVFNLPINELLKYQVKAIAYKGDSAFYADIKTIKSGEYEIRLTPISNKELKRKLRKTKNSIEKDIKSDINFYQEELIHKKREKKYKKDKALTLRIGKFLFPELREECIFRD